jgi:capsular exopolysaccharide synthesis family protein
MLSDSSSEIVVSEGTRDIVSEQLRALKTNIHHLNPEKTKGRVTLITSSLSGEGKSFVVTNLGISYALAGRKTIILEFDFIKPRISKNFQIESHAGISDYLQNSVTPEQITKRLDHNSNLFLMPAGIVPYNHSELIESERIGLLLNHLQEEYDEILVDSPPAFLVTDAFILARYVDCTVYIVRQSLTLKTHLEFIESLKDESKLPKMGIVFNGVQKGGKFGYDNRYDYSYYTPAQVNLRTRVKGLLRRL